jgi:hypothetical protein
MTPEELKKMFQFRWQVAGGKAEDFPFDEQERESFNVRDHRVTIRFHVSTVLLYSLLGLPP